MGWLLAMLVAAAAAAPPTEAPPSAVAYVKRCAVCHGESGTSDTPQGRALKVAPLVDDVRLAGMSADEIVEAIKESPKHRGVLDFDAIPDADLHAAAVYVIHLARPR